MPEQTKTFHESWYRIANQSICLKSNVRARVQQFRGERWYILSDPMTNQFFRLRPAAYDFVSRLNKSRTVEEVWKESLVRNPSDAPGQEDVIHLLAQLYHAGLLHYGLASDSGKLFDRYKKRKQQIVQKTLMNLAFLRIPLFDPDLLLKKLLPIVRWIISPVGICVWLAVVFSGVKIVIENFSELKIQSQGILAPSNLFLLYVALVFVKALHEFGHAFAVRRFGGEVHTMGIMFLLFNPLPYMDATAAWSFRSKRKRVLVGAAGMVTEIFVAACATFVWAKTGQGTLHALAYNIIFIASVSTILFNINPLLRFDGYYILSDIIDVPNLHTQASQQLTHLTEKYAFGCKNSESPTTSRKEAFWLSFFGIASGIYRVFVFSRILLFVADRFLLAGIIMAVICGITWVLAPLIKLVKYLASSPRLERTRLRAISVCLGTCFILIGFLYFYPFLHNFKSTGIVKAWEYSEVLNEIDGYVEEILVCSGTWVTKDQPLIKLRNRELSFQMENVQAKLKQFECMRQKAVPEHTPNLKYIDSSIASSQKEIDLLKKKKKNLIIKAQIDGFWVAPEINDYVERWILRGAQLGAVVNDKQFYFDCVVSQKEASRLFEERIKSVEVKLVGQADQIIFVDKHIKIPMEHTKLPSRALGFAGGGNIAINTEDPSGKTAKEPFYKVRAFLKKDSSSPKLFHGRSGKICFKLENRPLLRQWLRKFRQLIQKRYQI